MEISKLFWITLFLVSSAFAKFQFTAPTENCYNSGGCRLTCGPINGLNNVQFFRGETKLLTCLARNSYKSPCLTVPDSQDIYHSTYFDYLKSELIITVQIKENGVSNWTCINGNQEANVEVKTGYKSLVAKFITSAYYGTEGQEVNLICQVLVFSATTFNASMVSTTIIRNSDASNLTTTVSRGNFLDYRATTKFKCTDHYFTCFTSTGFGKLDRDHLEVNVKCPIQIFYNMIETNVTIEVGKRRDLELYYSGYPVTTRWYRNYPEGDMELNRISNIIDIPIGSRKQILFITNANFNDAGQYTVHVRQNDTVIKVVYHVTIVYSNAQPITTPSTNTSTSTPVQTSIASTDNDITFTSPAENCVYGRKCYLKCGKIIQSYNVKFYRDGKLFLTCLKDDSFKTPCLVPSDNVDDSVDDIQHVSYFDWRTSTMVLTLVFKESNFVSQWTCSNGYNKATVYVEAGYGVIVRKFNTQFYVGNVGQTAHLTCEIGVEEVGSPIPLPDTLSTSITRNGDASNLTTTFTKNTYFMDITARPTLKCTDHYFTCYATSGYGYRSNKYVEVNVKCPIEILYDMITTNVTIEVGKSRDLELYYSGYPVSTRWYRNFPEGDMELNRVNNIRDVPIGSRKEILFFTNVNVNDAGQYTVHVRQNDTVIKVVYHVTIIMPTTTKSTPNETSVIPPWFSKTEQPEPNYTTTEQYNITKAPYSTNKQIIESTTKNENMRPVVTKDNNGSCQQSSSLITFVVLAFLSCNFV